ncbi:MAG: FAD-dependent monooxygenase [Caulobacteraceae bacterium]
MSDKPKVLIAGAGIGGLVAGLSLLRRGFDVEIFEQSPQLGEIGAGFQISANGARTLFALGLEQRIRSVFMEPLGKEIRLWNTGETWKLFDLGVVSIERYGFPYFMIHRADLHGILVDAIREVKPDAIRLNAKCVACEQDASSVTVTFADGSKAVGGALIGADGVHSTIRQALFGASKPKFTGCVAWRGLVPAEKLPEHIRRPVGTNWVGPGGHIVHYFLRRGELFNFVAVVERDDWQVESWTERGTNEECAADFAGWNEDIQTIISQLDTPYKWALLGRDPMEQWSMGRITLLGDACHPTLPFLAQGAVMAIEDGFILGRCMDAYADVETALKHYEKARIERTGKIVRGSADNATRFHNHVLSNTAEAEAYIGREFEESKVEQRYDWLFRYDVTSVSID